MLRGLTCAVAVVMTGTASAHEAKQVLKRLEERRQSK
jgi:hypothetical protein